MLLVQSSGESTPKSNGNFIFRGTPHSLPELYSLPECVSNGKAIEPLWMSFSDT
ncbi:hypothetical protein ACP4OV_024025 [Aristida adscensionis]